MAKLEGKAALIVGSANRIGEAIAECFAAEGARIACTDDLLIDGGYLAW